MDKFRDCDHDKQRRLSGWIAVQPPIEGEGLHESLALDLWTKISSKYPFPRSAGREMTLGEFCREWVVATTSRPCVQFRHRETGSSWLVHRALVFTPLWCVMTWPCSNFDRKNNYFIFPFSIVAYLFVWWKSMNENWNENFNKYIYWKNHKMINRIFFINTLFVRCLPLAYLLLIKKIK